jgi:peptidoglycan/xylan/chitin deacetylase (PgdA/CDA1 family)
MFLPILTYHRLLPQTSTLQSDPKRISVSQDQFRKHLTWLKRLGYRTISLSEYVHQLHQGKPVASRTFAITFDDGYEEVLTLGLPLLQQFGFTATIFAVPGEERNRWDDNGAKLLTPAQLRQWRDAGMETGAHSCRHVHLTQIDSETARREISESKKKLEEVLGQSVPLFAYPYGETDDRVDALTREAGFEAAFATDHAPRDHSANLFRLRRSVVFPRNTIWEILCKVQTWYPAYQDWKRR